MSSLLVRPSDRMADGNVLEVTPETAGWKYVGFKLHKLVAGETVEADTGEREVCLVLVTGEANVSAGEARFDAIGARKSVFEGKKPYSVYVPAGSRYTVEALGDVELAVCSAPGRGDLPPRLLPAT